jgi:hypothetical protein
MLNMKRALTFVLCTAIAACTSADEPADVGAYGVEMAPKAVVLQMGLDLPEAARARIAELLKGRVTNLSIAPPDEAVEADSDTLVLAFGETTSTRRLIRADERKAEGIVVRQGKLGDANLIAGDGGGGAGATSNLGAAYAAYEILASFGFAFLHPLAPTLPKSASVPLQLTPQQEQPRWPIRGIQLHTMHPLELTDLLEGWGPGGTDDAKGWEAMLPEWSRFLEWMVANRLNRVQWVLLQAKSWSAFSESDVRHDRLKRLVAEAHRWGITVGIDAPVSMEQQHDFSLIRQFGDEADEIAQLDRRVDWLMSADFDYISSESGQSEFTHADPSRMLLWINALTRRVEDVHHRHVFTKVHTSTGQTADGFADPRDGTPLNINFLSHFADPRLGIMPHTVQHYGIDDPALTYGNTSFRPIYDFMAYEAGSRPVLWHPETAYWVSFDIDVPLFLPIYAERRVSDLRMIARDEDAGKYGGAIHRPGSRIDGQMIFSSGWEWGYWLNDVVTARASYRPETSATSDLEATKRILAKALPFGRATKDVVEAISGTAVDQKELLIEGRVNGKAPSDLYMRNGQAYLQGFETWDEISEWGTTLGIKGAQMTQPNRLGLIDMHNPFTKGPKYSKEIAPLLAEMETRFAARAAAFDKLRGSIPEEARDLFDDLADASKMTSLRSKQIHALYDYSDAKVPQRLKDARAALDEAATIVKQREAHYRTPVERVAGWRNNPTSYEFTYLWTVHSLYYWWRDEGKVTETPLSPCYKNIIDPVDVAFGEGRWMKFASVLSTILKATVIAGGVAECLEAPKKEPVDMFKGLRR